MGSARLPRAAAPRATLGSRRGALPFPHIRLLTAESQAKGVPLQTHHPSLHDYHPLAPATLADPHPYLAILRAEAPVYHCPKTGLFIVSSYDFVDEVVASGVRVAWMGYPELPEDAEHGFSSCMDELETFSDRLENMADADPDVIFVDARDVVQPDEDALFDDDNVHPSVEGSTVMGRHIADAIQSASD